MEHWMLVIGMAAACSCLSMNMLTAVLVWKCLQRHVGTAAPCKPEEPELPEETEQRRASAEAQRLYEQGFVNLMRYDGSPRRKEREEL